MPTDVVTKSAVMVSCMSYRDPNAAIDWLGKAFGFVPHAVYRDDAGQVVHAELTLGDGMIMIGPVDKDDFGIGYMTMPDQADGRCTQSIYVIINDVDTHHARAVAAGAEIILPPHDESYGGRHYSARDPDGHVWSFGSYDPWRKAADA